MSSSRTEALPSGTLTVMFTDIVNSTQLKGAMADHTQARRDAAYHADIKLPHDTRLLELTTRAGGRKVKSTGDGFLFTFIDAEEAILCALAIQDSLRAAPIPTPMGTLQVRIGLHTGVVLAAKGDYAASTVDLAARVQGQANPGDVLVSLQTRAVAERLAGIRFEDLGSVELKGVGPTQLFKASRQAQSGSAEPPDRRPGRQAFVNPYDFATTAGPLTFKGRVEETEDLLDSIQTCTHTAIFGLQRMGKTSLITQGLEAELETHKTLRDSILMATVDMQRLGGAQVRYTDFVHAIFEAVVDRLAALGLGREVANLRARTKELFSPGQYERGDRTEFFGVFAKLLSALAKASGRRIVLFIDEFSEIRKVIERNKSIETRNPSRVSRLLPHEMYIDVAFMRHLSSLLKDARLKQDVTFIVIVRPFLAEYDEREELQVLKLMKSITLRHLDETSAKALITKPLEGHLGFDADAVDYLYRLTAGHPYLLQFILKLVVDRVKRLGKQTVSLGDIKALQEALVSEGPAYDAQFAVLISDYSIDEVMHGKESTLGKGLLALIAKLGQARDGCWVDDFEVFETFTKYKVPAEKTTDLLSQLTRTRILEERMAEDNLQYRLSIPLVQERFVRQNMYRKYFRYV